MTTVPSPLGAQDRRLHPRKQGLAYLDFGAGNAGILSNLSECGLAFNGIGVLEKGQTFPFRFTMPGKSDFFEATGQIVWVSDSKKTGGLKFLELAEEARPLIRSWTSSSTVTTDRSNSGITAEDQRPSPQAPTVVMASSKETEGRSDIEFTAATPTPDAGRAPSPESSPRDEQIAKDRFELPETSIPAEGQFARADGPEAGGALHLSPEAQAELNKRITSAGQPKAWQGQPDPIAPPLNRRKTLGETGRESSKNVASVLSQEPTKRGEPGKIPQPPTQPPTSRNVVRSVGSSNEAAGSQPSSQMDTRVAMAPLAASKVAAGQAQERPWPGQSLTAPKPTSLPAPLAKSAPRPADEQSKTGRTAVLSRAARQREILKASQTLRFAAGVAVGCIALATIAGGLVATGKLRLVDLTPATSNTALATTISGGRIQDPGEQQQAVESSQSNGIASGAPAELAAAPLPVDARSPAPVAAAPIPTPPLAAKPKAPARTSTALPRQGLGTPSPGRIAETSEDSPRTGSPSGSGPSATLESGTVASAFEPPVLVSYTEPVYPPAARAAQVQGNVEVVATVGTDGVPRSLRVTSGDPQLGAAAIAAISNWRYRPATVNGQLAESLITVAVKFAL